jgi:hypothetical protein
MTPIHIVVWAAGIVIAAGIAATIWFEPQFVTGAWFWFLPITAIAYTFFTVALGLPVIALLKIRQRSELAYVIAVLLVGAALCGLVGAANGRLVSGAILGAIVYAATAFATSRLCDMRANPTVERDGRRQAGARPSP